MKRFTCFVLVLMLTLTLCACSSRSNQIIQPVTYYYRMVDVEYGTQSGVISSEIHEAKGHTDDYRYLTEQYLNGPRSAKYISPFPAGTTLQELNVDTNKVQIMLSPHLALLSGSELMVACACLSKTLLEMTGVRSVHISVLNGLLNNQETIVLTADSFAYADFSSDYIGVD